MNKVYHLSNCGTCAKIIKSLNLPGGFVYQNIKEEKITTQQIEAMHKLAGSYEALFSRRAMKYRQLGLNEMQLTEADYKKYILEEYTFLKRPVFMVNNQIFIGNAKKTVEALAILLSS